MPIGVIGAVASVGSSLIGASAARKAARSQQAAADRQIELSRETRDLTRADLSPYTGAGTNALNAYMYEMGLGPRPAFGGQPLEVVDLGENWQGGAVSGGGDVLSRLRAGGAPFPEGGFSSMMGGGGSPDMVSPMNGPSGRYQVGDQYFGTMEDAQAYAAANATGGTGYQGFQSTPGYDFRRQQGLDAISAGAAQRGGLMSGASMQALMEYGQDYATNEYNNYLNRLGGLASSGQNAAAGLAAANQNYATQSGNALGAMGNAQAAGAIGVGNAIQGGIGNALGFWQYQQGLNNSGNNSLFGNSWS